MMKKILFVASTASHITQFHLPYLKSLSETGLSVDVACPAPVSAIPYVREQVMIPFQKKYCSLQNLKAIFLLVSVMKAESYALLITHTTLASFLTRCAVFFLRKKPQVITVVHGYLFHEHMKQNKLFFFLLAEKLVARQTDLVLVMNQWDLEMAEKHHLGKKIALIPGMGVETPTISDEQRNELKKQCQLSDDFIYLVYGAEFSKRKNQKFLISAMKSLPAPIHLLLAGQGTDLEVCKLWAESQGVRERVHFLGQITPLPVLYQLADVVVSSSISEGIPFHLMEAIALAKVIVASDIKGHRDLLITDEIGYLFPLEDEKNFINTLIRVFNREKPLCSPQGKEFFQQHWELSQVKPQVMEYYLEFLL